MTRPSPELEAIIRRWSDAVPAKDARTLRNLFSKSPELRYVGTAFGELWSGQVVRDGFADHISEIPDFDAKITFVEAFEHGDIGWGVAFSQLTFPSMGQTVELRVSFVFKLEDGAWKLVQHHGSTPRANMETMGAEHAALDSLVQAAREGFRHDQREGMASVMFTDIANSSAIAAILGDGVWTDRIGDHLGMVTDIVNQEGGTLVKSLGDGTMSTFPSAAGALEAATSIQRRMRADTTEPRLELRVGLHTGDVIKAGNDFFGTVVNKAARITAATGPGEVRVSDATRLMVGDTAGFRFSDPVAVPLRGLDGDHLIYRLEWRE